MIQKPVAFPDWCMDNLKNKSAYPESKKKDGWEPGEIPPCEWENYFKNLVAQWTHYFEEQITKISMVGVPISVALPTFPSLGGYKCEATTIADELGFVLCQGQTIQDETCIFNNKIIPNLNNNLFIKGAKEDNKQEGNKNHSVDFNHTHNYAHTHEIMQYEINNTGIKIIEQKYITNPDATAEAQWGEIISFNGTKSSSDGHALQIVHRDMDLTTFYTSGVCGSAVNGFLNEAETSIVSGTSNLNIEPENITAVYIMRIK